MITGRWITPATGKLPSLLVGEITDIFIFSWKKLDSKSEDCKKLVDQYWKWEGADENGRAFNQGKIFK